MNQALHIFKKDVRRLWPQIAVVLGLVAMYCWREATEISILYLMNSRLYGILDPTLPLVWWYLISVLIHGESLVDDRQYWLTRPITWQRLLAAKALFILAVVSVPMLISDCVILSAQGFSPLDHVPGLLWRQVLLIVAYVLPGVAIAAVTKNLAQIVMVGFALFGLFLVIERLDWPDFGYDWDSIQWIRSSLVSIVTIAGAACVVILQYARRRAGVSRILAVATLLIAIAAYALAPFEQAFALQSSLDRQQVEADLLRISFDPDAPVPSPLPRAFPVRDKPTSISLPLRIAGVPEGKEFVMERITLTLNMADGVTHQFGRRPTWGRAYKIDEVYWHTLTVYPALDPPVTTATASARVSVFMTLYGNPRTTRSAAMDDPSILPDGGLCAPDLVGVPGLLFLNCRSALQETGRTNVQIHHRPTGKSKRSHFIHRSARSPFPSGVPLSPIHRSSTTNISLDDSVMPRRDPREAFWRVKAEELDVTFESWEPLAHVHRTCEIAKLDLAKYLH